MRPSARSPFLLSAALLAAAALPLAAHDEVRDPVCGMMIHPEKAAARAELGGRTWWFCQAEERDRFLAHPERYVSLARFQKWTGEGLVVVSADPASPPADSAVRLRVLLAPRSGEGADETRPAALKDPVLRVWTVDRDRPAREEVVRMQPLGGNVYGALRWVEREGEYRFLAEATTEKGQTVRATGSFVAGPRAAPSDPEEGPWTMAAQHAVMKRMGRDWEAVRAELEGEAEPDREALVESLRRIDRDRRLLPKFELHVNADAKPEFERLAGELEEPLRELAGEVERGLWPAARVRWSEIDSKNCVRCHMKFRWDVLRDLSRFPGPKEGGR
jgi:YHS domain-containing protein